MTDTTIRVGQVYVACHPLDEGRRIRITEYKGYSDARVVDADTGKRPRRILTHQLHAIATTRQGKPRRSGYALETAIAHPPATATTDATPAAVLRAAAEKAKTLTDSATTEVLATILLSLIPPLVELLEVEADVTGGLRLKSSELTDANLAGWVHGPLAIAQRLLESNRP
ncbi:hypothetical protein I5Q34_33625 [Streptomyces sp. AV19]|uniref:hypothetical protein n=1 Tax=Streptomyces sp. AV19 TaxID=2793068 RepID=UPI0018FEE279|nr:hypothetical protein [Streptomyces sp. AV19]MBH1939143.1 hypothetical protein [Streptomyces sp. AV19]MDG4535291.1 hypothetical protein [Streptomyces sp. AV19]